MSQVIIPLVTTENTESYVCEDCLRQMEALLIVVKTLLNVARLVLVL